MHVMSDTKQDPPSPDEISKKLEEFIKTQFGSNVLFTSFRDVTKNEPPQVSPVPPQEEEKDEG